MKCVCVGLETAWGQPWEEIENILAPPRDHRVMALPFKNAPRWHHLGSLHSLGGPTVVASLFRLRKWVSEIFTKAEWSVPKSVRKITQLCD